MKSVKIDYNVLSGGKALMFSSRCCKSNFMLENRFVKRPFKENKNGVFFLCISSLVPEILTFLFKN